MHLHVHSYRINSMPTMRKLYFISIMIVMSSSVLGQDLEEVYQQVLQSDPRLRINKLGVEVSVSHKQQAFGALLPQINIRSNWTENERLTDGGTPQSYSGERHTFSMKQPLYDMPAYYAWKKTEDIYKQKLSEQKATDSKVRLDTIKRYFRLLDVLDELVLIQEEKAAVEKKVEVISALYKLQRVKITEFYESKARLAILNTDEIDAMQAVDLAKEDLRELTNSPIGNISPLSETLDFIQRVENIDDWSEKAIPANYELIALQKAISAAESNISKESAGHLPLLELNLTKQKSNIGYEFSASSATITEVASLDLVLPLFSGGRTSARVYEATQNLELAKAQYEVEKRRIIKETRDTFLVVNALARRIESTNKSVESAKKSYQAMNRSFELGIADVSQVLDAQQVYSESKRHYQAAKYGYIVNKAKLLEVSGKLNDDTINKISKWLL